MPKIDLDFNWDWPELHQAFFDERKYVTIRAGRGTGKTVGAVMWLVYEMLTTDAQSALWMDTVNNNLTAYVEQYFQGWVCKPIWHLCNYNAQRKRLTLPKDKFIQFASAEEPKNAEGFRYHRVVLNEGGLILKNASLWDNTIEPMTQPRDGIENKTRIVGTPKGRNKFHALDCINDEQWGHYAFTINDSPRYTVDEIAKIKPTKAELVWKQEYLAEFLDGTGSVFRDIAQCITNEQYNEPLDNHSYVMSADLAKHQDFTVVYVADTESKKIIFQDRFNQLDWGFQKKRIIGIYNQFHCSKLIMDSTGVGDAIYDDLVKAGANVEGFKFTNSSKNEIVQNLSVAMSTHSLEFYAWPELINELEIFEFEQSSSGTIRYNAPSGYHDDCVISLALINKILQADSDWSSLLYI